jgi:MSHA biogenesis protein MshN
MSLINKMLQDLDARGTPGADAFPSQIRPVARTHAGLAGPVDRRGVALALGGTAAACAVAAAAWFGWGYYKQTHGAAAAAAPVAVKAEAPAVKPAGGMSSTISMGPTDAAVPQAQPLPAPVAEAPASVPAHDKDSFDAPPVKAVPAHVSAPAPVLAPAPAPKTVAGYEPDSEEARAARQAIMAELQSRMAPTRVQPAAPVHESKRESKREAKRRKLAEARALKEAGHASAAADRAASAASGKDKRAVQGRQESGSQRAEGEYRRALNALQDGRMTEAVAALEQALKLDPAHDAARQTLVGLLIEAKRTEEAMRHLQTALALDARQPALAMLLARLQIEGGGNGIDTLTRTLPYAGNNADYHAFLAGALQRQQRHREAAEQYQAALRTAPGNGVWWMGLGMTLQAEKRNGEALEAFQRARMSGTLSAELQAFVERRLQQLSR